MMLPSLKDVHVVVIGDVMLDRYWFGDAQRVSQEAPVPVVDVEHTEDRPGGAANVALNVASLGARCTLLGVVGDDDAALKLKTTLAAAGVACELLVCDGWSTVVKLRVVSRKQQLLRTDFESPLALDMTDALTARVDPLLGKATALVLQDYDKGTLRDPARFVRAGRDRGVPVIVDPKHKAFSAYAGCTLLKPNTAELEAAVGRWSDDDELLRKARDVARDHHIASLVVTRGARGMTVVAADGAHQHVRPP